MNTTLVNQIKQEFLDKFNEEPLMVFSPGRINIIGEHTDYNDGFVFPAAVNKGIIAAINKTQNSTSSVSASDFKDTISFSIDSIAPMVKESWGKLCFRCYCRNTEIR
ncbi:galactokinase [Algibacter lectus]|uniref:Galactokinase n=1 Tax=Algibacter lectus TaxID=221126 RepID=A0A090WV42_9FLAO|nr:galactokinase family protein [Algibacter lectus]GAL80088.1 galactokinase [Algibacter lectus]